MLSRGSACISSTIPIVFLLEHILHKVMDKALEAKQLVEEEGFIASQSPLYHESVTESQ